MQYLLSPKGEVALIALLRRRPLLAFDFDGTLASIVARPGDARSSPGVSARLGALAARLPLAIITGRSVQDVQGRLGFTPSYILGNHGAEGLVEPATAAAQALALNPLRERLSARKGDLAKNGVTVEDKGGSIALHYRLSRQREQAKALIDALLSRPEDALRIFGGKMVVNAAPIDAPDKAQAMQALVARSGADCAFFAGDDINDEPVFAAAPADWLTVRVGRDGPHSLARYFIESPAEMTLLLGRMVVLLNKL